MKMTLLSSLCAMAALSSTVSGLPPVDSPNPFTPLPKLPYGFESIDSFLIPTVGDLDGDGDLDVVVGLNEQELVLFRNVGTPTEPFFERIPGSLIPSNQLELDLAPALVDIDGDGDLDLFVGTYSGNTFFFRNTGTPSVPVFTAEGGPEPFNLPAVEYNATPVFADLNGDGLQDAIIGEAYGRVRVFNNIGTPQEPLFGLANTSLLIDGTSAYPVVAPLDADGDTDLDILLGSINGATEFYRNTGSINVPVFVFDPEEDTGIRGRLFADSVAPSVADWNGDGRPDLVVGLNGDVVLERNISTTDDVFFRQAHGVFPGLFRLRYPVVPAVGDLDGDGDVDALVSEEMFASTERPIITFFRNEGTPEAANFQKQTAEEAGFNAEFGDLAGGVLLTLEDIDGDGDFDLFALGYDNSTQQYALRFLRNTGTPPVTVFSSEATNPGNLPRQLTNERSLAFNDVDGDGDRDVIWGSSDGSTSVTLNTGTPQAPVFGNSVPGSQFGLFTRGTGYLIVSSGDVDGDGFEEVVTGEANGNVTLFRRFGSDALIPFGQPQVINSGGEAPLPYAAPMLADWNGDGLADLMVGSQAEPEESLPPIANFVRFFLNQNDGTEASSTLWILK